MYYTEASRIDNSTYDSFRVFRLDVDANEPYPIRVEYGKNMFVNLCKGPYGHIYETVDYRDGSNRKEGRIINNANELSAEVSAFNLTNPIELSDYYHINNLVPYDYMKLYHTIDYDCGATVSFQNKTDRSAGMDSFTWHFTREDGSMDTVTGFEPSISYTKSGDYFYKVLGLSQEGREYGEWYIDTLKIRIPPKPVASFTATDTVVCAYSAAAFTNESTTDTIHTINGEKWVWSFGDGETQTYNSPPPWGGAGGGAEHVYTRPGTYTVSLFYSNGFCDSTLTKNQYITVVDAPAPGFSIDNNRGCTPFTVNITDTITRNTVKKEIIYGDGTVDTFYANSLPPWGRAGVGAVPHEYTTPGNYWITQRLYGYTGCITQLDSVRIYVTPGFTEADTMHITYASYPDVPAKPRLDEVIAIHWPCLLEDSNVRYDLYRNKVKIAELDARSCVFGQMGYNDSLEQASSGINRYTVVAIDSCGTAAQVGRVGQPVYVSGEVVGNNELSVIRFTAYQDWDAGEAELSYELQVVDEFGAWQTIKEQNSTESYTDFDFLGLSQSSDPTTPLRMTTLEKCYRVVARLGTSRSSISNILCLPYLPVIFIATAFSPNGDNLNDVWRPVTFGVQHYEVEIYNTYGQKLVHFTEKDAGWAAADIAMGAYMVTIRAKGTDNEWYNLKSTVTVVR